MIWGLILARAWYLSLLQNVQTVSGSHSPSYSMGNGNNFPRAKLSEHETDHSPPSGTKVRRSGAIPLLILLDFMVWTWTTFYFYIIHMYGKREYHRHTETNMISSIIQEQFQFIPFTSGHVITHTTEPKIIKFHFTKGKKDTVQDFMSTLFPSSACIWHQVPRWPQHFTEWLAHLFIWEIHGLKLFPGIGSPVRFIVVLLSSSITPSHSLLFYSTTILVHSSQYPANQCFITYCSPTHYEWLTLLKIMDKFGIHLQKNAK